jgi:hypothetical protein
MFKKLLNSIKCRWNCTKKQWTAAVESRAATLLKESWSDYCQTIREAVEERTFPQLMAALTVALFLILLHLLIWCLVCVPIGLLIQHAWNHSLLIIFPHYIHERLTFHQGWALSFLGILVFFRSIKIDLSVRNQDSE